MFGLRLATFNPLYDSMDIPYSISLLVSAHISMILICFWRRKGGTVKHSNFEYQWRIKSSTKNRNEHSFFSLQIWYIKYLYLLQFGSIHLRKKIIQTWMYIYFEVFGLFTDRRIHTILAYHLDDFRFSFVRYVFVKYNMINKIYSIRCVYLRVNERKQLTEIT